MLFAAIVYGVGMIFTGILMFGAVYHVSQILGKLDILTVGCGGISKCIKSASH